MSVKHDIQKFKHKVNEKFAKMLPSQAEGVKTVLSSTSCGRCRQWCLGRTEHIAPLYAWQTNVKASVFKARQMSSFCHIMVEVPSCLTAKRLQDCRPSRSYRILRAAMRVSTHEFQRNNTKVANQVTLAMTSTKRRGHYSWVTKSKVAELNPEQHQSLSGHIAFLRYATWREERKPTPP